MTANQQSGIYPSRTKAPCTAQISDLVDSSGRCSSIGSCVWGRLAKASPSFKLSASLSLASPPHYPTADQILPPHAHPFVDFCPSPAPGRVSLFFHVVAAKTRRLRSCIVDSAMPPPALVDAVFLGYDAAPNIAPTAAQTVRLGIVYLGRTAIGGGPLAFSCRTSKKPHRWSQQSVRDTAQHDTLWHRHHDKRRMTAVETAVERSVLRMLG
jgi:hypothetical protein